MSDSRNRWYSFSSFSMATLVPPYSGRRTLSPTLTNTGTKSPLSFLTPGPTATTSPCSILDCAFSGMTMPPAVFVTASALLIRTRSSRGIKRFTTLAAILSSEKCS
ncbi:unnamed protein product [Chrysodeixis includens]|uniref:Uncharacterized protein n=1 Tax=Chrysodeixis includens TaxID=689277 RepID=A0A9P0BLE4_CHRIL|nr:unnamed protein product [Chrysodeixis includens]